MIDYNDWEEYEAEDGAVTTKESKVFCKDCKTTTNPTMDLVFCCPECGSKNIKVVEE